MNQQLEKHKARDIWDRHISAKLPTQKGHSFSSTMTRVRRDTHLPYYTENPRKNLHLKFLFNLTNNTVCRQKFTMILSNYYFPKQRASVA